MRLREIIFASLITLGGCSTSQISSSKESANNQQELETITIKSDKGIKSIILPNGEAIEFRKGDINQYGSLILNHPDYILAIQPNKDNYPRRITVYKIKGSTIVFSDGTTKTYK